MPPKRINAGNFTRGHGPHKWNATLNATNKWAGKKTGRSLPVAVSELVRRAAGGEVADKNSFAYLWASPGFKYTLIAILVLFVLAMIFLVLRWRKNRKMMAGQ